MHSFPVSLTYSLLKFQYCVIQIPTTESYSFISSENANHYYHEIFFEFKLNDKNVKGRECEKQKNKYDVPSVEKMESPYTNCLGFLRILISMIFIFNAFLSFFLCSVTASGGFDAVRLDKGYMLRKNRRPHSLTKRSLCFQFPATMNHEVGSDRVVVLFPELEPKDEARCFEHILKWKSLG